ncbi:MAG: hypothetical protein HY088_07015 [Ignavibacteriales bacterium]|nr:hypothetical protein [Ignavibacteriales bacterium]
MKFFLQNLSFVVFLCGGIAFAQDEVLTDIRNLSPQEVKFDGFALDKDQEVSIKGYGVSNRDGSVYTTAWILDARTRKVVWNMRNAKRNRSGDGIAEYNDLVALPKGEYEVYYSAFPYSADNINNFGDFMEFLGNKLFKWGTGKRDYKQLSLTIRGSGKHYGPEGVEKLHEQLKQDAIVSLTGLWDNDNVHQGFILEKPMDVTIYSIGEARDDGVYDYGWIINAKTGEKIWAMTYPNSDHAGGDRKNRMVNKTIALPAGSYAAFFVTDDSHSYRDWNAPPPYDPSYWGLTIRPSDPGMKKFTKLFDYKAGELKNVIVEMIRMRDHEFQSKGFTLNKPMDVRVYAIGEGSDYKMADYGWIVDARTKIKVWTMEYNETDHAGGDQKNRLVDKVIHLDKGSYMAYYVTDGSHSYRDWNAAPPFDPEHWGLTVTAVGENFTQKDIGSYEEKADKSVLVRMVGMGDDERKRQSFTLSKTSEIHIYAIGEGTGSEMDDYAWIEDATSSRVVWEMTYRMTEHAGGARKNRMFDGSITLPAGKYVVYYQSDGSHSFNDWNDDPPSDPANWGVTVTLSERKQQ